MPNRLRLPVLTLIDSATEGHRFASGIQIKGLLCIDQFIQNFLFPQNFDTIDLARRS